MGDPRRIKIKYVGPGHPWQKQRIEEEKILLREYGLKNKRELWKMTSRLKAFTHQAKNLIAATGQQAEVEKQQLFSRLQRLGLISAGAKLDDILGLGTKAFLERRLQTQVFRKGYAHSPSQARQFISHGHIMVNAKPVSAPGYLVTVAEEAAIGFVSGSTLAKADHPERIIQPKKPKPRREKPQRRERRR